MVFSHKPTGHLAIRGAAIQAILGGRKSPDVALKVRAFRNKGAHTSVHIGGTREKPLLHWEDEYHKAHWHWKNAKARKPWHSSIDRTSIRRMQ